MYCCSNNCEMTHMQKAKKYKADDGAGVKILGSGCSKCNELETNTVEALQQLGMDTSIEHIADFTRIAAYGVMTTPALVIDGKVVSYGKVLKTDEAIGILKKVR